MGSLLAAFFAFGFFAATVIRVFWMLVIAAGASIVLLVIALLQHTAVLHAVSLGAGTFAVAQVGYGLGLLWVASRDTTMPD